MLFLFCLGLSFIDHCDFSVLVIVEMYTLSSCIGCTGNILTTVISTVIVVLWSEPYGFIFDAEEGAV